MGQTVKLGVESDALQFTFNIVAFMSTLQDSGFPPEV